MAPFLEVDSISCSYAKQAVVNDLSFVVSEGAIGCLLGPSGCGKTTILRAIAGFHALDSGTIRLEGKDISKPGFQLLPEKRGIGMVFQDHALFPHMNVFDNIGFGFKGSRSENMQLIEQLLERLGLQGMNKRYPHELSGGQQQRVALARALAPKPKLLLMDEPFSNLDLDTREKLNIEVREILKEYGTTGVLVTHDQQDAFALCDRVGVMVNGAIVQWDSPYNLYHEPANRFVADFIGDGVFLKARLVKPDTVETSLGIVQGNRAYPWAVGSEVDVLLRPDDVVSGHPGDLTAMITRKAFKGAQILYTLTLNDGTCILSLFPSHQDHALGEQVYIRLKADHLVAFQFDESLSH